MGMVWVASLASDEQLASIRQNPESAYEFANSYDAEESGRTLYLDKQWHGIHFMLTRSTGPTDSPLSIILGKYEEIGPDNGYGPAWIIPASAWKACHVKLSSLPDSQIRDGFDTAAMEREQVYLADLFVEEGDEALHFLMQDIGKLRKFAANAAENSLCAIALIT